jgi:hypothetical protein
VFDFDVMEKTEGYAMGQSEAAKTVRATVEI